MEVRIESMICVWDDAIPTMFLEFVNLLTLTTSEGELRKSVKEFAEKHELDTIDRELFSCVKPTLDECRAARDKWLNAKKGKEDRL